MQHLGERHGRQLDREAAALPHPALHFLDALLEVRMTGIDVRPGVDDRDHRLAGIAGPVVAHLRGARAMPEGAQVLRAVPAVAAQLFRLFPHQSNFAPDSFTTRAKRDCSVRNHSPSDSGVPARTSVPCLAKRSFMSAEASTLISSALSLATDSGGRPLGPT